MSLRIWLPLDGDLHNQGASNLVFSNLATANTVVDNAGKIGKCYSNNSNTAGGLISNTTINLGTNQSMFCWINFTTLEASSNLGGGLVSQHRYSSNQGMGLTIKYISATTGYLSVNTGNGSSRTFNSYLATTLMSAGTWYHVGYTYDGINIKLYVNGVCEKTQAYAGMSVPEDYLTVFCWSLSGTSGNGIHGDYKIKGKINDVRIYDHALSAAEVHEIAQGLVLHYKLDDITYGIKDSSGYNHNGTSFGSLISNAETGRYSSSTKLNSSSPTDNSDTGMCYIQTPFALTTPLQMSITWWAKPESGYGGSTSHAAFCTSNNTSRPTDYNTTAFHHRDSGFDIYPSDASGVKRLSFTYTANTWHHYAITYDGSTAKAYQDGVLKTSVAVGSNKTLATFSQLYIGFSQAGGVRRKTLGSYSDFRVYVTALSADDVLALYHTGAKIDNKANVHTYEINENGANKLTKTGILYDNMIESIMTLPDDSYWQLLMFHYVDNGNNLFTSSNANNCNDFGLFSRLKDIDNFKLNNRYEFYAIQDDVSYRWIQTNAPLTTTSVAGFSTVSGYTSPGAGICKCSGNTLLARTNSTGNWWNAFGCYTVYSGGIPGLNSVVCKKYLALYARIEKPDVKLSNQTANSFEFIEL